MLAICLWLLHILVALQQRVSAWVRGKTRTSSDGKLPAKVCCVGIAWAEQTLKQEDAVRILEVLDWLSRKHVQQVYLHAHPGIAVQNANQDPAWGIQDLDGLHETPRHGRMTVTLLKPEDAVGMLVKAAQQPQSLTPCWPPPRDRAPPQPQLIMVFGPQFCIAGFPPWLLQCAELFHLGSVHTCGEQDLEEMLQQFHHTPQRMGT